jgi:hypothetical protein
MSSLIDSVGAISPQLLAGYGQGRAKAEDYNFRARQAEAQREIARQAQALRAAIAEREAEHQEAMEKIARFKADLDLAEHEAKKPLTEAQTRYYGERSATEGALRHPRVEKAKAEAGLLGLRGEDLQARLDAGIPALTGDRMRAQILGMQGTERRAEEFQPHKIAESGARTTYLGAQAATIPKDDARQDSLVRSANLYRDRMAKTAMRNADTAEIRAFTDAQRARDRTRLETVGLNLEKIRTTNDTTRANAYRDRTVAEVKLLEGFPKEWIQSLDRDLKLGYTRDRYGNLPRGPAAEEARRRADFMLKAMEKSILFHDFEPVRVPEDAGAVLPQEGGGPPALPSAGPSALDGLMGALADPAGAARAAATGALGPNPAAGLRVGVERARQGLAQGIAGAVQPVGQALGLPSRGGSTAPPPASMGAPRPEVKEEVAWLLKEPTRWQYHISMLRSKSNDQITPHLRQVLNAYQEITGRPWHFGEYQDRPRGLSNGDIDMVKALLADGTFDSFVKGARATKNPALVADLIAGYRYLYPGKAVPRPAAGRPRPTPDLMRPARKKPAPVAPPRRP